MTEKISNPNNRQPANATQWDTLANSINQPATANRQQRKLINYYLSGGKLETVLSQSDANITHDNEMAVYNMIRNGEILQSVNHKLLDSIRGPLSPNPRIPKGVQIQRVLNRIETDPIKIHILESVVGFKPNQSQRVGLDDVDKFYRANSTPMEFDEIANEFLRQFDKSTPKGREAFNRYSVAMQQFKHDIYGKKQEYYEEMKQLERNALASRIAPAAYRSAEGIPSYHKDSAEREESRNAFKRIGGKILEAFSKTNRQAPRLEVPQQQYELLKSSGVYSVNKGDLIGNPQRKNEDSCINDPRDGLFGVFDGMGGHADGAVASETAVSELAKYVSGHPIRTQNDLRDIMKQMSASVRQNTRGGGSTAVIGQIIENAGRKYLLYAWAGDSRLYHIRNGAANQITKDEGFRNVVTNYLGIPESYEKPAQAGILSLNKGDHLLFCSDGVTGDEEKDFIPNQELAAIIENATSTKEAAINLTHRATKKDDRTAVVVEI